MIWRIGEFALLFKYRCLQIDIPRNEIQFLLSLELSLRTVIMKMVEIFSLQWLVSPRYCNCHHDFKQLQYWSQWSPQDMWGNRGIQIQLLSFSFPLPEGFFYTGSFSPTLQQSNITGWWKKVGWAPADSWDTWKPHVFETGNSSTLYLELKQNLNWISSEVWLPLILHLIKR